MSIESQSISLKDKLNMLSDYFQQNRAKFKRILIFVIDDADLLENAEVRDIVLSVLRNLALGGVKKWLVIREGTYNGYDIETRNLVDAFFPDRRIAPETSLFDIVKYRIEKGSNSTEPKNPYSEEICYLVIERLHNGNIRESLAVLRNLLDVIAPKRLAPYADESVIQNYMNRSIINGLLTLNILPNLYDPMYRSNMFPLPIDILMMNRYFKSSSTLMGSVNMISEYRVEHSRLLPDHKRASIRSEDFDFALEHLINLGLAEKIEKKMIQQTKRGSLLADYIDRANYKNLCKELLTAKMRDEGISVEEEKLFWNLTNVKVNHQEMAMNILAWDKPLT